MAGTETITVRLVAMDLMSGNVSKAIASLDKLSRQSGIAGWAVKGMAMSMGSMLNPAMLVGNAIGAVTGAVQDSIGAFREDEVSQAQLRSALEANIEAWNGNTGAIESVLAARMKLGFSDDEQRASLAMLVAQTKDASAALKIEGVAMDLARLKSISLSDAAGVLGKAYTGSTTALAKMGIKLRAGATGAEALAEVQKRAAGQAEAYGKTSAGAAARLDASVGELQESLGSFLNGPAVGFTDFLNDLVVSLQGPTGEMRIAIDYINRYGVAVQNAILPQAKLIDEQAARLGAYSADLTRYLDDNRQYFEQIGSGKTIEWIERLPRTLAVATGATAAELTVLAERVRLRFGESEGAYRWFLLSIQDMLAVKADAMGQDTNATVAWAKGLYDATKGAADDIVHAAGRIRAVPFQMVRSLDDVKSEWKTGWQNLAKWAKDPFKPEDFQDWIKRRARKAAENAAQAAADGQGDVRRNWTAIAKAARSPVTAALVAMGQDVDAAIAKVMAIQALAKRIDPLAIVVTGAGLGNEPRASGGPVFPGRTYRVGEQREETLVMGAGGGGYVFPGPMRSGGGGGGGGNTINVYFQSVSPPSEADGERVAAAIGPALTRWQRRQGVVR